ncbi:Ger(x)C family spore germination protein [Paenibacillus spongiae]|uniref:Ger(X)C family spore germination protein n=1 Tax=Paenibacillus spongiae TaxID=2909671 RepID=A0ABY5S5C4_9BACL|nr:Ger(x)C family spore germination protein [Paenibacillus spongiae]UVI28775.1 Ger(x)C family spore germination protein [Paenibacillus spongiae]
MKVRIGVVSLMICAMLTGCIVKTEVIEDIYIALAVAVDFDDSDHRNAGGSGSGRAIQVAVSVPEYKANRSVDNVIYKGKGNNLKDAQNKINYKSDQYLSIRKLGAFIMSEDVLRSGIKEYVEALSQDPMLSGRLILAMTEGKAADVLKSEYHPTNQPIGRYICSVVENNIHTFGLPLMNLHQFVYEWKGAGMDPVMPIINKSEHMAEIAGIALMKDAAYVGKLSTDEMIAYSWMKKNTSSSYNIWLPEQKLSIQNLKTRVRYQYKREDNRIHIRIHLDGDVADSAQGKFSETEIDQLSASVNRQLEKRCEALIDKLQRLNTDPLGIGNFVRSRSRDWNEESWKRIYPKLNMHVVVVSKLRR